MSECARCDALENDLMMAKAGNRALREELERAQANLTRACIVADQASQQLAVATEELRKMRADRTYLEV